MVRNNKEVIKDKNSMLLTEKEDFKERWREYSEVLL